VSPADRSGPSTPRACCPRRRPLAQTERITTADAFQEEIDSRFFDIVTDLVGTPNELIDEHGDIAWHTRSTLWGTTAWATNSTAYTPLRFPGQYYDPETGLHYNYFRHYDPDTARYLTLDPLGLAPAPNPATYVHNPHTWTDTLGLAPDCDPRPVWEDIKPTQPNYPGTEIPKSFEMQAGDQRVWVHANATKHLNEYMQGRIAELATRDKIGLINQVQIKSLQQAVVAATKDGIPLGKMVEAGGWELKFSQRPEDPLPALVHALYTG
jgi:RHS repeat-associated protein